MSISNIPVHCPLRCAQHFRIRRRSPTKHRKRPKTTNATTNIDTLQRMHRWRRPKQQHRNHPSIHLFNCNENIKYLFYKLFNGIWQHGVLLGGCVLVGECYLCWCWREVAAASAWIWSRFPSIRLHPVARNSLIRYHSEVACVFAICNESFFVIFGWIIIMYMLFWLMRMWLWSWQRRMSSMQCKTLPFLLFFCFISRFGWYVEYMQIWTMNYELTCILFYRH